MDHIFSIQASVEGHLGSFHNLAIVDNTTINIGVHITLIFTTSLSSTGADGSQAVPITDLKVGDCLSEVDDGDRAVYDVRVVDCGSAHSYEVFHKGEPRAYPAQDDWTETIGDLCTGPFEGYVGLPPDQSRYTVSAFTPQKSTWDNDLRTVTCIALPDDDTTTTGSAKNAKK